MELQGPEQYRDSFAKEMLRFNRGGIVSIFDVHSTDTTPR
jgi:hypothetical protein